MGALRLWGRRCLLPGVVLGCVLAGLTPAPAAAESAREADARAARALRSVSALEAQVQQALGDYERAVSRLADAVSRGISTEQQATAIGQLAQDRQAEAGARARALYRSGGPAGLYASVLGATSISEAISRVGVARQVVSRDLASAREVGAVQRQADRIAADAQDKALAEVQGVRDIKASFGRLTELLDRAQALLTAARGRARTLRQAEQAAARLRAAQAASEHAGRSLSQRARPMPGSSEYFALYRAAAQTCPGLSWSVLAAIGQVESGHGRNPGVSYAGAQGPMQFMPKTFAHYGVDGDGDGREDIQSPADAIFSAAAYLCANGAGKGERKLYFAIYRYNHADWYVQLVLTLAAKYLARDGA